MKITPEALIQMGFELIGNQYKMKIGSSGVLCVSKSSVWVNFTETNATTIEDIKDLIRLFK